MAEQVAVEFESMFATLAELAFNAGQPPRVNISVVHFRRPQDYEALTPRSAPTPFVLTQNGYDFEDRSRVVLHGELLKQTREVMWHELTHIFVGHYYPRPPIWLNEGFAEYYSTVAQEGGFTVIGRPGDPGFTGGRISSTAHPTGAPSGAGVRGPADQGPGGDDVDQFYGDLTPSWTRTPRPPPTGPPSPTLAMPAASSVSCSRTRAIDQRSKISWPRAGGHAASRRLGCDRGPTCAGHAGGRVSRIAGSRRRGHRSYAPEYAPARRPPEAVRPLPIEEVQMLLGAAVAA
jgi:hypothetical protein